MTKTMKLIVSSNLTGLAEVWSVMHRATWDPVRSGVQESDTRSLLYELNMTVI